MIVQEDLIEQGWLVMLRLGYVKAALHFVGSVILSVLFVSSIMYIVRDTTPIIPLVEESSNNRHQMTSLVCVIKSIL